jgi:acyl-CoA thioesterase-1
MLMHQAAQREGLYGPSFGRRQRGRFLAGAIALLALLTTGLMKDIASAQTAGSAARTIKLVALGDSLTAGYGLPDAAAFPAVLEAALKARGHKVEIANAGVSGDTASGGLERLEWSVPDGTDGVILELGANDMLRGIDPDTTKRALDAIVTRLKARGIPVLLAGMYAGRNLGPDYVRRFDAIYPALAEKHGLILYPFFLDGVAGQPKLALPDGLHPTAEAIRLVVARILPSVEAFLARLNT